ncbi:growth/differentiation factor 9 [Trichosurus vulpecula]|uniref:growth/differentiation factor 9 n=1 Tax=Trichosurus vulpecula TaxID=9337 RepID=UPI00186B1471|nr:growth/differentiation factor 9 [Trichosurus vulpecula]
MAMTRTFILYFCCSAWMFSSGLGSQTLEDEAGSLTSGETSLEPKPLPRDQPLDGENSPSLLPPLLKVLVDRHLPGAPRLHPDSRALRYMKRLYKAYTTKEGIPKSDRSHLYNTVRLFTPNAQHPQPSWSQVTGGLQSMDLLFNLDRITAPEHLLKSVLLYSLKNSVSFSSTTKCMCYLIVKESECSSPSYFRSPQPFTISLQFEFRKNHKWIEIDVTTLLQPLVASKKRNIHIAVNFTCLEDQQNPVQDELLDMAILMAPSLLVYLNDTSAQAYHRWNSLRYKRRHQMSPDQRDLFLYPMEEELTQSRKFSRHRRDERTGDPKAKSPKMPVSNNLSEYFKQFLFPENECELHDFKLSFSQLKWDNWIVAPHRYNPRYCKGVCPRLVRHRYGSPVHTMVQNIIYEKLDSSIPRPSCVPAKYSPLSVLTIEPDGSIAYKEYEDMIATKCTCR